MSQVIGEFKGQYRFLSNFYIAPLRWSDHDWPHSEAAYQAAKTLDHSKWTEFQKMTPVQAKHAGKALVLRPDWEKVKVRIMLEIVLAKFRDNPDLRAQLIETGEIDLEEGNTWGDKIWGISPPYSGRGDNNLGLILMQVRTWYQNQWLKEDEEYDDLCY